MEKKGLDFKTLCAKDGERCDLHFLVENEVIQNKARVEKLESRTADSFMELNKSLNDLIVEMRTYVGSQEFRDNAQKEMKSLTRHNTEDITELKTSLNSLDIQIKNVNELNVKTNTLLQTLSDEIKALDKTVLSKNQITEVIKNVLISEKNTKSEQWFDSLPAKISAGVALLSFIAFFTIKIVVLLLSI